MWYYIIKVLVSSILIVIISEVSKKSSLLGAIFASLPLVSFIAIFWIFFETRDIESITKLSESIFWLVLPSLSFFLLFPFMLKKGISFLISFGTSTTLMIIFYFTLVFILKKFGMKI